MINKGKNAIYTLQNREVRKEKCTIATHKNLSVKIDYISIIFDTATAKDVITHVLHLPIDIFNVYPSTVKFKIYQTRWEIGNMFGSCESRYGVGNYHFTRLDVAIDDKNEKPFFTIEQIKKKYEKEEFVSNSEEYKFDDFDTAKTIYIGAGKSSLSYRFYDKDKKVCS